MKPFRPTLPAAVSAALLLLAGPAPAPLSASEDDLRLGEPLTLHGYHPFRPVESAEQWETRREEIRARVLAASGLLPLPERTPLNARRFGAVEGEGFTVERVHLESFPGHYVTGSLFLPAGESLENGLRDGKRPGILCPHGHWAEGRFYDLLGQRGERALREAIANGSERFESAARNPIIARCVQLARMGCIVFVYDLIGYADSVQFAEHRRGPREGMDGAAPGTWGFVSPQATLRLQTNFGLQNWNSIRALDFLLDIEAVDEERILVTGASGGATQTMMLAAVDDRVAAAFPAVMVSTAMQGGCTCENSHYLRIGQGNIDIAAAVAPRPLGLTAADDWTIELEDKGHPDLQGLYEMLGVPRNYEAHFDIWYKHNFNHVSRAHLYSFASRHLDLGFEAPVLEEDYAFLGREELSVWGEPAVHPEGFETGDDHERSVNRIWAEDADRRLEAAFAAAAEGDAAPLEETVGRGWEVVLRRDYGSAGETDFELDGKEERDGAVLLEGRILNRTHGETVSARFAHPADWNGAVVVHLSPEGREGLAPPRHGESTVALDLFGQRGGGANRPVHYPGREEPEPDSWRRSPVYFYGYNDSVFVRRVHDLLSAVRMIREHPDWEVRSLRIEGEGDLAAVALAAGAVAGDSVDEIRVAPRGFRFASVEDHWDPAMVPGAVRFGDLLGLAALNAPRPLVWEGDEEIAERVEAVYRGAGAEEALRRSP